MEPNLSAELNRLHHRELLRQAEQERVAAQASAPATAPMPTHRQHEMYAPALRRLRQLGDVIPSGREPG